MTIIDHDAYRLAFVEYLRKGTPIRLARKQAAPEGRYVWRTQDDAKVRPSHRANDGQLFDWSDAPETGHPGADYNCRCQAIPYVTGETEFAFHTMQEFPSVQTHRYGDFDLVAHYYYGDGRTLTLAEIGLLQEIAEHYAFATGTEGAFRRLSDQIADKARSVPAGRLSYDFDYWYDFGDVEFSHGGGSVKGTFQGTVIHDSGILRISGESSFVFSDSFADPWDIGTELGGQPYNIAGTWTAGFSAEVFADSARSIFKRKT
jgi:SPP1 gp7 family putative phage head morphogenesis protein